MDLPELTAAVCGIAGKTAGFLMESQRKLRADEIEEKSGNNFVTWVDKTSEARLIACLSELLPGSGVIAEEGTAGNCLREYTWIIDPLDGTTNYIHGLPLFCISIALLHREEVVSGVIYEAGREECFYAWKGGGAWMNGAPVSVSGCGRVADALLATGFPYYDYSRLDPYLGLFRHLMQASRGVRRLGSAAADLAYVACGRFDGFYEYGLSPWDVAAGALLVREAGGSVGDFRGGSDWLFGREIVACNPLIYKEMIDLIHRFM